ncbi:DUF962 domain-containing protein [bacterium]|nr:DUF962 domain-containing protein [bacterium]
MKNLESVLRDYAHYHQNPTNQAVHVIGTPIIVFSTYGVLGPTFGGVGALGMILYYFLLDWQLGLFLGPLLGLAWWGVWWMDASGYPYWIQWALFIGAWVLQFIGHGVEGRKPALGDNILQIFAAPASLAAKALFALGWKPDLGRSLNAKKKGG